LSSEFRSQFDTQNNQGNTEEQINVARNVINLAPEIKEAWWYTEDWPRDTIVNAPAAFDDAFERWREL
jgi:hypothetical protein